MTEKKWLENIIFCHFLAIGFHSLSFLGSMFVICFLFFEEVVAGQPDMHLANKTYCTQSWGVLGVSGAVYFLKTLNYRNTKIFDFWELATELASYNKSYLAISLHIETYRLVLSLDFPLTNHNHNKCNDLI